MSEATTTGEETPTQGASEPAEMVIVDGIRYRPDELPDQLVRQGLIPADSLPSWFTRSIGGPTEEELTWKPARGSSDGYPIQAGGSGRGGYPKIS